MPDDGLKESLTRGGANFSVEAAQGRHRRRVLRNILVLGVVAAALLLTGRWAFFQWTTITETDARITTDQVAVSSRVEGWVVQLPVTGGDPVGAGELLVAIDARDSTLQLAELTARLSAIGAERQRLTAENEMIDLQTNSRLSSARSRVEAAAAAVAASRDQLELARAEYARIRKLQNDNVVSQQRFDQARIELSRGEERYQVAVANMAAAEADEDEARADRQQMTVRERRLDVLRFEEAQIAAERDRQALDVGDRTIVSNIDGVVSKTFVDVGEFVRSGQRLMLVHDPHNVWVEANIKETELRHLKAGMPVTLHIDAYPDRAFTGTVERIGQAATSEFALLPNPNPSGNFTKVTQRLPIRISVEQEGTTLRPGMMVVVEIDIPGR